MSKAKRRQSGGSAAMKMDAQSSRKRSTFDAQVSPLPEEIVVEILARLPAESLMRFKCVCKRWSCLIRSPYLAELHQSCAKARPDGTCLLFDSSIFLDGRSGIAEQYFFFADQQGKPSPNQPTLSLNEKYYSSSDVFNGLVLLQCETYDPIFVCNVSTREIIALPISSRDLFLGPAPGHTFGCDSSGKVYKVLKLCEFVQSHYVKNYCEIITLGGTGTGTTSSSWREIDVGPYKPALWDTNCQRVCLDGAMYWTQPNRDRVRSDILEFDVNEEISETKFKGIHVTYRSEISETPSSLLSILRI